MKRYLILSILSLITILSLHSEVRKKLDINAHPINVAVVIVEKGDSAKVADLFNYYGYTLQGTEEGYNIMRDSNNNEIRYSYNSIDSLKKYPKVIVKCNEKNRQIEKRLDNLKFKKVRNIYEHMINRYNHMVTQCELGSGNTIIFQRILNNPRKD